MTGRAHLLLVLLTMGALGFVLQLLRSGRLRARFAMLWLAIGGLLVVLAAFPGLLDWTAERVGIFYPPAVFLLAGIAFLLLVAVQFSWEISRLEERTRILAEEIALLREGSSGPAGADRSEDRRS
jgi:hypothetical protein